MKHLNANQLHQNLVALTGQERKILNKILDHLAEVNRRKIFFKFGHDSLLKYCVKELKYSEAAAYRRIKALRITQEDPGVRQKVERGELNLTQLCKAQNLFENHHKETRKKLAPEAKQELLQKIKKKSSFESENKLRKELKMPVKRRRVTIEMTEEEFQSWVTFKGFMVHKNKTDGSLLQFAITKAMGPFYHWPPQGKTATTLEPLGNKSRDGRQYRVFERRPRPQNPIFYKNPGR